MSANVPLLVVAPADQGRYQRGQFRVARCAERRAHRLPRRTPRGRFDLQPTLTTRTCWRIKA